MKPAVHAAIFSTATLLLTLFIATGCDKKKLPKADFFVENDSCTAACTMSFFSTSENATTFQWNFGDSTFSTEMDPKHTYQQAGTYRVTLTVFNSEGSDSKPLFVRVLTATPPQAKFTIENNGCTAACTVKFKNQSQGATDYAWSFGDNSFSTEANPQHLYTSPGTYKVRLHATNAYGTDIDSAQVTIAGTIPNASFSFSNNYCNAPCTVYFQNLSANGTSYHWNFGDGATSNQAAPSHQYTQAGIYNVTLTVSNAYGSDTYSQTVIINSSGGGGGGGGTATARIVSVELSYVYVFGWDTDGTGPDIVSGIWSYDDNTYLATSSDDPYYDVASWNLPLGWGFSSPFEIDNDIFFSVDFWDWDPENDDFELMAESVICRLNEYADAQPPSITLSNGECVVILELEWD